MSYEAVVYFNGPETQWARKISDREVIARKQFSSKWLARLFARGTHRNLDPARCGYAVLKDGADVEHVEPNAG